MIKTDTDFRTSFLNVKNVSSFTLMMKNTQTVDITMLLSLTELKAFCTISLHRDNLSYVKYKTKGSMLTEHITQNDIFNFHSFFRRRYHSSLNLLLAICFIYF